MQDKLLTSLASKRKKTGQRHPTLRYVDGGDQSEQVSTWQLKAVNEMSADFKQKIPVSPGAGRIKHSAQNNTAKLNGNFAPF